MTNWGGGATEDKVMVGETTKLAGETKAGVAVGETVTGETKVIVVTAAETEDGGMTEDGRAAGPMAGVAGVTIYWAEIEDKATSIKAVVLVVVAEVDGEAAAVAVEILDR